MENLKQTTFDEVTAELPGWEKSVARQQAVQVRRQLARDHKRVNDALYEIGRTYHASIPLVDISDLLVSNGFESLEDMILCGRDGSLDQAVGRNRWLNLTWHKMESGRYEIVAYIS